MIGDRAVSPLLKVHSDRWTAEYTSQLIDLLNVVGMLVELQAEQAALLKQVLDKPTLTVADLTSSGVLPIAPAERVLKNVLAAADSAAGRLFSI
jgi:hypothetical protein